MMHWMLGDFEIFGFTGHNWMLAGGLALAVYILALLIARRWWTPLL